MQQHMAIAPHLTLSRNDLRSDYSVYHELKEDCTKGPKIETKTEAIDYDTIRHGYDRVK